MAGYGNRTAPDYVADDMTDQHDSTRLGLHESHGAYSDAHPKYGSGATGGAGFGASLLQTPYSLPLPSSTPSPYLPSYRTLRRPALKPDVNGG